MRSDESIWVRFESLALTARGEEKKMMARVDAREAN